MQTITQIINRHLGGEGRITLNFIENVSVIRSFSYKTKILNFHNLFFNKIIVILLSQFTNSCLFTLDLLPLLLLLSKNWDELSIPCSALTTPNPGTISCLLRFAESYFKIRFKKIPKIFSKIKDDFLFVPSIVKKFRFFTNISVK